MTSPEAIAAKFAELAGAVTGVKAALDHEPEELPSLPCVTMLHRRLQQDDRYTGPATENTWTWSVFITIPLGGRVAGSDWQRAQATLYTLLPAILAITRQHPDLDDVCGRCSIADLGDEPDFDVEAGTFTKTLELSAVTQEV